jgi:acetolactate synthase-1/3 small subunit
MKVVAEGPTRGEIIQIAEIFRARIVDVAPKSLTIETTGDEGKILAMINMLKPYGLMEVVRTGKVAMARGMRTVNGSGFRPSDEDAMKEGV